MDNAAVREPKIIAGEASRSHAAVEARARRAASGFAAYGIEAGDAVALLLGNDFAVFEAQRAAALLGAAAVPLDRHMGENDLRYVLEDCAARVLVAHVDLLAPLRGSLPPGLRVVAVATPAYLDASSASEGISAKVEQTGSDDQLWDAWLAGHPPFQGEPTKTAPSLSYTSGSTGRPKGVRRAASSGGSAKARRVYGFDKPGRAVALVTGPLSHSVPRAFARLAHAAGADIVLMPRFDPERALALIARHGVTHVHLSPAMMVRMLRLPTGRRHDVASLRHVIHGAAPCPPAIKAEAIAAWGPIVHEYYGSTETGLLTLADSADAARHPGCVGRALPGITLAVLDDEGRPVPAGTAGTIYAGSASLHRFTYHGREADRAAIGRGDLVTAGDVGHLDADGYLYLHDRGRDLIRIDGETLVPAQIEAAILALPDVADCAVFGLPAGEGGEIACACVEPLPGTALTPDAIREALGAGPVPGRIEIVADLPRADTGKVFKHKLRERLSRCAPTAPAAPAARPA